MYKHLLVHMDGGDRSLERLGLAIDIAQRCGARLTGLFAEGEAWGPSLRKSKARQTYAKALKAAASRFESKVREAGVQWDWWRVADREMDVGGVAARFCRYADLAILGQPDPDEGRVPNGFASQVLLESGRPVLLVPSVGHYPTAGRRVLVAWNGSREAARSLGDAIPLMTGAEKILVVEFQTRSTRVRRDEKPQADVVQHLAAYGLTADRERVLVSEDKVRGAEIDVLDELLNLSSDLGADLVVMGARGRHGVPFPRAGRRTRRSLEAMTAPVLLSH